MTEHDMNIALFYAFRYALGRQTYAVGDVTSLLIKYAPMISGLNKSIIIREINLAISDRQVGMKIDMDEWLKVVEEYSK